MSENLDLSFFRQSQPWKVDWAGPVTGARHTACTYGANVTWAELTVKVTRVRLEIAVTLLRLKLMTCVGWYYGHVSTVPVGVEAGKVLGAKPAN